MTTIKKRVIAGLAVILPASALLTAQGTSPRPSNGAITGTVIDGSTGTPVPGAVVQIAAVPSRTIGPETRQVTDDNGRFAFLHLPGDTAYTIAASKIGYLDGGLGRDTGPADDLRQVRINTDEWVSNLKVTIWKPGSVSGVVRDETGDPVVGVYVRVLARVRIQGREELAAGPMTVTDDRGAYRIAGLGPGKYIVQVPSVHASLPPGASQRFQPTGDPDGVVDVDETSRLVVGRFPLPPPPVNGKPMAYPMAFHPSATLVAQASTIELRYGDDRSGVDVTLTPVPASRVSGVVVGPAEALQFLTLRLLPPGLENLGQGAETATAFVDPSGRFTFLYVPAGTYTIDAPPQISELTINNTGPRMYLPIPPGRYGWNRDTTEVKTGLGFVSTDFRGGAGASYFGRSSLTVGNADVRDYTLQLRPTVTLRGRIVTEIVPTPRVLLPTQQFSIRLDPAAGDAAFGAPRPATIVTVPGIGDVTSFPQIKGGDFSLSGLMPGKYWFRVMKSETWLVKSIAWKGRDYANEPLDASAGEDLNDVVITVTNAMQVLSGSVRGTPDLPAEQSIVVAFPTESASWRDTGLWPARMRIASISSGGTYRVSDLPAGTYFVAAIDRRQRTTWQDPAVLAQIARSASRVTLPWSESVTQDVTTVIVR
jgi:carboxypeptidase family protein